MGPCKIISDTHVFVIILFPTPPIKLKLKLGLQVIITHFNQSNYLANQKQGEVNKFDLTVFIRVFQASSEALKGVGIFKSSGGFTAFD
jgi:hypothetical protein